MSPFDSEVIERKNLSLKGYLQDLEAIKDISLENYQADIFRKRGIEKTLINLIQCAIDINNYILAKIFKIAPADNYDSFIKLGENKIIPPDFALKIAPSTGLRSRLIHEYNKIDDRIVHASIKDALKQFPRYIEYIQKFLQCR
ncbi:MAG: DUF86 domain-containing protein [Actinomycetota bacterium]